MASEQARRPKRTENAASKKIVEPTKTNAKENKNNEQQQTLGEITKLRQQAQQSSIDAIRAAEEKAGGMTKAAKDAVASAGKAIAEKAAAAKDAAVETGKGSAHYAGELAGEATGRAAAAGWTAVHYTTEKAVEGTVAAAKAVQGAAEYAGSKTAELAYVPLGAAKQAASATAESLMEFAARKREEAVRELEARGDISHQVEGESSGEAGRYEADEDGQQGSIWGAIGETIKEIVQTTKTFVIGHDD